VRVSEWLRERKVEVRVVGLGGVGGTAIVGSAGGGGRSRVDVDVVFLLLGLFLLMVDSCVRSLALFWTRVMMSDAGTVCVGGCTTLSGFCSALAGRTLPTHHVSLDGALFLGRLILQMPQDCSSGLFRSYVHFGQVHVVVGGVSLCC
jgi:hypothetical protein